MTSFRYARICSAVASSSLSQGLKLYPKVYMSLSDRTPG